MGDGKVAFGVKNSKRSIGALKWALNNLVVAGDEIVLIHVQHPIRYVPTPVGNLAVGQLSEEKVAAYAKTVQDKVDRYVDVFKRLCHARQVNPRYVQIENDSVPKALVDQISVLGIHKLILGRSHSGLTRRLSGPRVSTYVADHAPSSCSVLVILKDKVVGSREDDLQSISSQASESDISEAHSASFSSSSSQGETTTGSSHPQLFALPDGLGRRWSFLSRFISSKETRTHPTASPTTPLNEINGARMYVSPFHSSTTSQASTYRSPPRENSSLGVTTATLELVDPKLNGSGSASSSSSIKSLAVASNKLSSSESSSIAGSLDSIEHKAATTKAVLGAGEDTDHEEANSNESTPTPRRRKSLRELTKLSERNFREYEFAEIEAATGGFSEKSKLGEGGYGTVYKGKLQGRDVAVKVLKKEGFQRSEEFQHEVELLGRIQHPHMVILLGCCSHRGCLVYELMANGSLEDRLFQKNGTPPLPWYTRFRVAAEVACALHFLHKFGPEPIVHRDLKPANILLDQNNRSKLGDVGLAKLVPERLAEMNSTYFRDTTPVGTFAYIDPEYQRTGLFGPKSDVYALGIVILQLLTGKPPVGVHAIVEEAIECGTFSSVLDKSAGDWPVAKAEEVACLALQCAEMKRRQRPNLELVLPVLDGARNFAENCVAINATNKALAGDSSAVVPSIFVCPLFEQIMEEPVVAADGYTYEYEAIRQWFQTHDTSPLTNLRLEHKQLTPHHTLHKLITDWKARNKA